MSILVNRETRVICQGITGKAGEFHTRGCKEYGTKMVGGVTPGKLGEKVDGVPVFDTVEEAVKETGANATMIFVPPPFAADAIKKRLMRVSKSSPPSPKAFPFSTWSKCIQQCARQQLDPHRSQLPRFDHAR
ncbi:MAG: hypothetical protein U0892_04830 [Pirellulales bacterium]